jgi:hypothetical protein
MKSYLSDTLRDNLASARVEIPLALEGDSEFRSLRNSSAIPVGPAQSERCKSLRFPIKFRAINLHAFKGKDE